MEKELSLFEIFQIFKKRATTLLLIILGFVIVGGSLGFFLNEKVYTSTASLVVGKESERDTDEYNSLTGEPIKETYIKYGNDKISDESGEFYKEIVRSNELLEKVIDDLNLDWSVKELKENLSIEIPEDSSTIQLTTISKKYQNVDQITDEVAEEFKRKNAEITGLENIKTLNLASESKKENTVDIILYLLLSIFFGVIVASIVVLVLEYFDKSIQSEKDVRRIGLPILGRVSEATFVEDLKKIRTNIQYSSQLKDKHTMTVVTVSKDQQNISPKLTEVFAETAQNSLLIDGDFRSPDIHNELKLQNNSGLSDVLTDTVEWRKSIQKKNKNYNVITTGSKLENPSEKLSSLKMKELINELKENFAYIIIKGHPINEVTDSEALSTLTDGIILQVQVNETNIDDVIRIKNILSDINVEILGVILLDK